MLKTHTEFDGFRLKAALEKKAELTKAGKTAEELPAALGEALKLEGDKLALLLAALEVAESRPDNLKRVVVFNAEEGKPGPSGAVQKGEKWFLSEFFYVPQAQPRRGRGGRDDRGEGKRGGKKGRRGGRRGDRDRDRGRTGDRAPGAERSASENKKEGGPGGGEAGAKEGGRGRRPRGDRGPRPQRRPDGPPPKLPVPNKVPAQAHASGDASEKKPQAASEGPESSGASSSSGGSDQPS